MKIDDYSIIMPGRIVEYFPETQTATVKISDARTYSTSSEDDVQATRPLLEDVPVYTSGGGGWHITFPIKPDDPCLLNFSQFGYDHWLFDNKDDAGIRSNNQPQPWTKRRFDLADGFAQVGWNNIPTAITDYNPDSAEFRNEDASQRLTLLDDGNIEIVTGTTKITLTGDSIILDSDSEVTVNTQTANINAETEANVNTANANITATAEAKVDTATATVNATAAANITSPMTTINGALTVTGPINGLTSVTTPLVSAGALAVTGAGAATVAGSLTVTGEVSANGIDLSTHMHPGDGGTGSGPNTGPPIP